MKAEAGASIFYLNYTIREGKRCGILLTIIKETG